MLNSLVRYFCHAFFFSSQIPYVLGETNMKIHVWKTIVINKPSIVFVNTEKLHVIHKKYK